MPDLELSTLELQRRVRVGQIGRTERGFLDFVIDGQSLWDSLGTDMVSCLGWLPEPFNRAAIDRLLLRAPADFPNDRRSLYICPECADLGCGAVSVVIERDMENIVWRDFGYENNYDPDVIREGFEDYPTIRFDASRYLEIIQAALMTSP